jgi:uncharacterized membrane protein
MTGKPSLYGNLAGSLIDLTYSARMQRIWLLLLCVIILAFCGVVYVAFRSWRKMRPGKRIVSLFLLAPHFLLVCIVVSLL